MGRPAREYREFGQRLAQARTARGLSRVDVARSVGIAPSYYARIERGMRMVSLMLFAVLWCRLGFDAGRVLDALSPDAREPSKRASRAPRMRVDLAGHFLGLDRFLVRARMDAGLTREELARAVGASRRQIGRMECGHELPSVPRFARLRRVLGFDANRVIARLLGRE